MRVIITTIVLGLFIGCDTPGGDNTPCNRLRASYCEVIICRQQSMSDTVKGCLQDLDEEGFITCDGEYADPDLDWTACQTDMDALGCERKTGDDYWAPSDALYACYDAIGEQIEEMSYEAE